MTLDCEESFLARAIFPRISHALPPCLSLRALVGARVLRVACVLCGFFFCSLFLFFLFSLPPPHQPPFFNFDGLSGTVCTHAFAAEDGM